MITAVHTLLYADDAAAARAFFRDVLQLPAVDTGGGWLIFRTGPSELGVHPTTGGEGGGWSTPEHHEISLICDDLDATMAELAGRGATFAGEKSDRGFGTAVDLKVPGTSGTVLLFQPRYDPPALG